MISAPTESESYSLWFQLLTMSDRKVQSNTNYSLPHVGEFLGLKQPIKQIVSLNTLSHDLKLPMLLPLKR